MTTYYMNVFTGTVAPAEEWDDTNGLTEVVKVGEWWYEPEEIEEAKEELKIGDETLTKDEEERIELYLNYGIK